LRRCSYSECDSITPLYAPNCSVCERVLKPLEP
jgi:hypothetical protein